MNTSHMTKAAILGSLLPKARLRNIRSIVRNTPVFDNMEGLHRHMFYADEAGRPRQVQRALREFLADLYAKKNHHEKHKGFYLDRRPLARLKQELGDNVMGNHTRPGIYSREPSNRTTLKHERVHALQDQLPFWLRTPAEVLSHNKMPGSGFFKEYGAYGATRDLPEFAAASDFYGKLFRDQGDRLSSLLMKYPKLTLGKKAQPKDWSELV